MDRHLVLGDNSIYITDHKGESSIDYKSIKSVRVERDEIIFLYVFRTALYLVLIISFLPTVIYLLQNYGYIRDSTSVATELFTKERFMLIWILIPICAVIALFFLRIKIRECKAGGNCSNLIIVYFNKSHKEYHMIKHRAEYDDCLNFRRKIRLHINPKKR